MYLSERVGQEKVDSHKEIMVDHAVVNEMKVDESIGYTIQPRLV